MHMMPKVVEGGCGGHEQIFLYRFETLQILINIQMKANPKRQSSIDTKRVLSPTLMGRGNDAKTALTVIKETK